MNRSMMHWSPDREPDPVPIHGWDARMDPNLKADVPFRDTDDPEGAQAWLNSQLPQVPGEPEQEVERLRSVPFPPGNVRPPTTEFARETLDTWVQGNTDYPRITAEEIRASMEEAERVRRLVASLPNGEISVPRRDEPMRPYDAPAWPSPETIERPNFPRRSHAPVVQVTIRVRTLDGLEETYEIDQPEDLIFRMSNDLETIDMGDGRVLPGRRSLRELAMFALSPRNWRRLPTRRWQ